MAVNEWPERMIEEAQDVFGRPEGRVLSRDEAIERLEQWRGAGRDFLELYRDGLRLDSTGANEGGR
ncbi:MAG: hypothetical protein ABEL51_03665 [Salinibacter sp.]